jgi:intracellular septation protein
MTADPSQSEPTATPVSTVKAKSHDWRRPALEMGPLGVFFLAYTLTNKDHGLIPATVALMIATAIALVVSWRLYRKLAVMPLVSGVVVLVFGGLTLYFADDNFIMMKPTIVNALFGTVLLGGLAFGRPLLQLAFDAAFDLDETGWKKLTFRWGLFFFFLAGVNEVLRHMVGAGQIAQSSWVTFKVFGVMPITFVFALSQVPLIQKHTLPSADEAPGEPQG